MNLRRAYFQTLERARAFNRSIQDSGRWSHIDHKTRFNSGYIVYY